MMTDDSLYELAKAQWEGQLPATASQSWKGIIGYWSFSFKVQSNFVTVF
jgi:hypothetical protein